MKHTRKTMLAASLLAVGLLAPSMGKAVTMTFEVAPDGGYIWPVPPPYYSEAGFKLTSWVPIPLPGTFSADAIIDGAFPGSGPLIMNTNGTDIYTWESEFEVPYGEGLRITLAKIDGGTFDFLSFDTAILTKSNNTNSINVIGNLFAGGTVITPITQTIEWKTYVLGYEAVTSVDFVYGPSHTKLVDHAFDNLTMNVPIPEPSTLVLVLVGLGGAGLCASRRRK